jgi:hypothetical protein
MNRKCRIGSMLRGKSGVEKGLSGWMGWNIRDERPNFEGREKRRPVGSKYSRGKYGMSDM